MLADARKEAAAILRKAGLARLAFEIEEGCLRVHPGEPFFVLRAQDVTAASVVDFWVSQNQSSAPELKLEEARDVAFAMRSYAGPRKNAD